MAASQSRRIGAVLRVAPGKVPRRSTTNLLDVTWRTRMRSVDDRLNEKFLGGPEQSVRLWWFYLVMAACIVAGAFVGALLGAGSAAVAALGPVPVATFMGGFYYSARLRSQGKVRGRFGPVLPKQ